MECFDLYGIDCTSLDVAKNIIEKILDVEMQGRDSCYLGDYFLFKKDTGEEMRLLQNIDHQSEDDEDTENILEPDFPAFKYILRVESFPYSEAERYKNLLEKDDAIFCLRREKL